MKKSWTQFN